MREAKRKRLREAWGGPLTAGQIARANAISERTLYRLWDEERAAGKLPPADKPRPHFAKFSKAAVDPEAIELDDDAPLADPNPSFRSDCDALLAALAAHHPEINHAGAQDASPDLLRFDRRGMPPPTHGMLMAMCRAVDFGAPLRAFAAKVFAERAPA